MSSPLVAPYGTWKSPITASAVAEQGVAVEDVLVDPVTSDVYHLERRPTEGGRNAIVATADGRDIFGKDWNARTGVHEYGGRPAVAHGGVVYFSNYKDGRVYKCVAGQEPLPVTPESSVHRFADFDVHPAHPEFLVGTLEDHTHNAPADVATVLCAINTRTSSVSTLVAGADFYASARFSPDGKFLAWRQWHHPDMPWMGAEIFIAPCTVSADGSLALGEHILVGGQRHAVCVQEPNWVSPSTLVFLCDAGGFLNPWQFTFDPADAARTAHSAPIAPAVIEEDFGEPQWILSWRAWAVLGPHHAVFSTFRDARAQLYVCDLAARAFHEVETPYVTVQYVHGDARGKVVFLGRPADANGALVELTLGSDGAPLLRTLAAGGAHGPAYARALVSRAQHLALRIAPDAHTCHVNFYAPHNPAYAGAPPGERPPAIVFVHGGPNYMTEQALDWKKQFFTSRGWAWIDLNHGGSSGFGREYRDRLNGQWGIVDVDDAVGAVAALDAAGLVDAARAVIRGGSAGGFCSLAALTTRPTAFAAAAPAYGVSDMRKLDAVAHKFESRYIETLMGGTYDAIPDVWRARSPIFNVQNVQRPVLVLQGAADTVVPPAQMEEIVESIRKKGGRADYVVFEGEGHGWRKAETIQAVLEKELAFFEDVLGLGHKD